MGSRRFAVAAILAVLAVACGDGKAPPRAATEISEPDRPSLNDSAGVPGQSGAEPDEERRAAGPPPPPNVGHPPVGGGGEGAPQPSGPSDDAALGANSFFYLNGTVGKLVIEIDHVEGYAPTMAAVDLLVQRLRSVADKPEGIQVLAYGKIPGRDSWSLEDLKRAERQSRTNHSSPVAAVMHILYLNGRFAEGALGVAFSSSAAAVFIEDLRANEVPTVPAEAVERATLVHEAGHLLALVNITYRSPRDHEDPNSPGHSKNIESVMYAAVDNVGVFTVFRGLDRMPPTDFDTDDRADLADLKSGKLP